MNNARNFVIISIFAVIVLGFLLIWSPDDQRKSNSETLLIYCAAGMKPPVSAVAKSYEEIFNIEMQLQYGGSGTLLNNLRISQKGDLYLAADQSYIDIAHRENLLDESISLATITPVIAVPKGNPKKITSIDDLLRTDLKIALGNPDAASIGKSTKKLLTASDHWDAISQHATKNGVFYPTVPEVANSIKIGQIDAGIIWDATVNQYPELDMINVPELDRGSQHTTIGILRTAKDPTAALKFARFLAARDKGLIEFSNHGYKQIDGDLWAETPEILFLSGAVNRPAIEQTIIDFENREGVKVSRSYNGCGILVSQIRTGTDPDLYFACDRTFMTQVQDLFFDPIEISETDMLIIVPKGNRHKIQRIEDLTQPNLKIGLANEDQSALGSLTAKLLIEIGIYDDVRRNVVTDTPTADLLVTQMIAGSLDAAIVYEANTTNVRDRVDLIRIDHPSANAIQPIAIGKNSDHQHLTNRLITAIRSAESKKQFTKTGFRWRADEK